MLAYEEKHWQCYLGCSYGNAPTGEGGQCPPFGGVPMGTPPRGRMGNALIVLRLHPAGREGDTVLNEGQQAKSQ